VAQRPYAPRVQLARVCIEFIIKIKQLLLIINKYLIVLIIY
jgi:hypothetical protein